MATGITPNTGIQVMSVIWLHRHITIHLTVSTVCPVKIGVWGDPGRRKTSTCLQPLKVMVLAASSSTTSSVSASLDCSPINRRCTALFQLSKPMSPKSS